MPGGETRIDAAKKATKGLVDELGEDAPLGLVTYGTGTGNSPAEHDAGCRDISVVRGPTAGGGAELKSKVDGLQPRGYTPMGEALRTAAGELPDEGARTVVLVSDGIDTCAPPPVCDVAKELKDKGVDLVVNTVGLLVDEEARAELSCIADATGGTYADATDAASLGEQMRRAATRTYDAYTSEIAELPGTPTPTEAPEIPKGDDVGDRFGGDAGGCQPGDLPYRPRPGDSRPR
jgi:Ca-activated chloride channel family protein